MDGLLSLPLTKITDIPYNGSKAVIAKRSNETQSLSVAYQPRSAEATLSKNGYSIKFNYSIGERAARETQVNDSSCLTLGKYTSKVLIVSVKHDNEQSLDEGVKAILRRLKSGLKAPNPSAKKHYSLIAGLIQEMTKVVKEDLRANPQLLSSASE